MTDVGEAIATPDGVVFCLNCGLPIEPEQYGDALWVHMNTSRANCDPAE